MCEMWAKDKSEENWVKIEKNLTKELKAKTSPDYH